jgi:C-terminal processing protease CtpA/Prc
LLGAQTASAGEFTAIAFEGRPNTRFFGETTAGFVSTNSVAPLPDGAEIAVSTGYSTDRLHRPYRSAIVPDEATPRGQPTLDAAIAWLKRQPCPKR